MKMILELNDEDGGYDIELHTHALGYCLALNAVEEKLRDKLKWGELSEDTYKALEEVRDFLFEQKSNFHLPSE